MYLFAQPRGLDRISLKYRSVATPAQITRAVVLGGFFAVIFIWILPSGSAGVGAATVGTILG